MLNGAAPGHAAPSARNMRAATLNLAFLLTLVYAIAVVYGSLLPFDWVASPLDRVLPAYLRSEQGSASWSIPDVFANIVLFVPLGFLVPACFRAHRGRLGFLLESVFAVLLCALLAAIVEFAQLYFPPRDSSWRDLVANIVGTVIGVVLNRSVDPAVLAHCERALATAASAPSANPRIAKILLGSAIVYLGALCVAAGLASQPWTGAGDAFARIGELGSAPFRTYVAANVFLAIVSAAAWIALYAPIGVIVRYLYRPHGPPRLSTAIAAAAAYALAIEAAKLFVEGKTADTGNALIAALGACTGFVVVPIIVDRIRRGSRHNAPAPAPGADSRPAAETGHSAEEPPPRGLAAGLGARTLAMLVAAATFALVVAYPLRPVLLAAALAIYAGALLRWPAAWLWVVPAALPVVDLGPLTGRFYLDEFDGLILVTVAAGAWAVASGRQSVAGSLRAFAWLTPLAASVAASAAIGLWPFAPLDSNAFASYFSHYNALRVAKGFAWSLALVPLVVAAFNEGVDVARRFATGTAAGLAGVVVLALWERVAYPGLLDFARDFRIGAFVSSMHMGGGHIETYLLLGMPLLLPLAAHSKSVALRVGCAMLFVAATYALMVTFSRAAYGGYAAMVAILLVAALRSAYRSRVRWSLGILAVAALGLVVAAPIVSGGFAKSRLDAAAADFRTRVEHWRDALQMMLPGTATRALGMGLGRYPLSYLFGNREGRRPAAFRYERDGADTFLRMGSGDPLYVEQIVDVVDRQRYRLSLRMRANVAAASLNVLLCERTYFYSYGCTSVTFAGGGRTGEWERREDTIDSGLLGAGSWPLRRAVKLSLENASQGVLDVDDVSLVDNAGRELIANGSFSGASDHWYFSSNLSHLSLHVKNLWVGLLFEQGVLGVVAFVLVVLAAGVTSWRRTRHGDLYAGAALAALAGFLCIGLFDTLIDAPRLTLMLLLTLFATRALFEPLAHAREITRSPALRRVEPPNAPMDSAVPAGSPPPRAAAAQAHPRLGPRALRSMAITVTVIAVAIAVVTRLPWIPYNVRSLPNPFHPIAAPVVLAVFVVWVFAAPAWIVVASQRQRATVWGFPLVAVAHGVVAWWIVRFGALPGMIHKVTGAPVLGWPWDWETLVRFAALDGTLFALFTLGALAAAATARLVPMRTLGLVTVWVAVILVVAYRVIIVNAATDNLTELLDPAATVTGCAAIAAWAILVSYIAGRIAAGLLVRRAHIASVLAQVAISAVAGFALLWSGTTPSLSKYGLDFSALQFLLSADRSHYAGPVELALRYAITHVVLVLALAFAQASAWRVAALAPRASRPGSATRTV